jgi:hypothetical protein
MVPAVAVEVTVSNDIRFIARRAASPVGSLDH